MRTYKLDDIRRTNLQYDPRAILPPDWEGTLLDVLDLTNCPAGDALCIVLGLLPKNDAILAGLMLIRQTPLCNGREVYALIDNGLALSTIDAAEAFLASDKANRSTNKRKWKTLADSLLRDINERNVRQAWRNGWSRYAALAAWALIEDVFDASTYAASASSDHARAQKQYIWSMASARNAQVKLLRAFIQAQEGREDEDLHAE